jgi:cytochrome c peroxidase
MSLAIRSRIARAAQRQPLASISIASLMCTILVVGLIGRPSSRDDSALSRRTVAARRYVKDYVRPAVIPFPADNPYTPAREALGQALFFDPRLSGSGRMSCSSCHKPALSWGDGLPRAVGHDGRILGRRTPTILNLAWSDSMFWDGRASTLEEQALGPIQAAGEMNSRLDRMVANVAAIPGYRALFAGAYPGRPISQDTVAQAIATFERHIVSGTAPFDGWLRGDDGAMSANAQHGFELFNTKAQCSTCHSGWRFTDDSFHDIGVPDADRGRGVVLPTIEAMQHAFKTPTLRNVDRRAPYMHDGSVGTLEDVITFYDRGGLARRPSLASEIKPLGLTPDEMRDVVAFLRALTSADKLVLIPALPR